MSGLARQMPWTMAAFALASLSLVGIPPASGFVSKWYLALGSVERGSAWLLGVLLVEFAAERGVPRPRRVQGVLRRGCRTPGTHQVVEVPWMVIPLVLSALASLLLGIYPDPVLRLARRVLP